MWSEVVVKKNAVAKLARPMLQGKGDEIAERERTEPRLEGICPCEIGAVGSDWSRSLDILMSEATMITKLRYSHRNGSPSLGVTKVVAEGIQKI